MSSPRVVVIPFGVPAESRGLGLGLAAAMHAFVRVDGEGIGLARLHARRSDENDASAAQPPAEHEPVEAFVPVAAWRDLANREGHASLGVVVTGSFEPPTDGQGLVRWLAFDADDGRTRARGEAVVDDERAGATMVGALEQLWSGLGGTLGALEGLRDVGWPSLESVLRAERCALYDPARAAPHDRFAAMMHLGRALEESPRARYPAERLAFIALETAAGPDLDVRTVAATLRALERAVDDAPAHVELLEALATLLLRAGRARDAERRMNEVVASTPKRGVAYPLLARTLTAQGKFDGALAALQQGFCETGAAPGLDAERGATLAVRGDRAGAAAAWREALARDPVFLPAFEPLAAHAIRTREGALGQTLVDAALTATRAHPDVFRRAVQLALFTEGDGLARAARIARLCERILEGAPEDPQASLALARALVVLGDAAAARVRLDHVVRVAPASAAAAEAHVTRLAIDEPAAEQDLRSVLRAARTADVADLADVAARARRLATQHAAWPGWLAAAVAEQRRGRWAVARSHLESALEVAPGAAAVHIELAAVLLELEDASAALAHAERALSLEGDSPRAMVARALSLDAVGRGDDARAAARRALEAHPDDEDIRELVSGLRARPIAKETQGWAARWRTFWNRPLRG